MKSIDTSLLGLSAFSFISGCTFVDTPEPSAHTTTTVPAAYGSVKTTTTRSY